jgi:glutaredoxin 3
MIKLYVLEGCPYCNKALDILKKNKIKHKKIVVENTEEAKKYYKKKNKMDTFPQIFLDISETNSIKIGGCSDLENLMDLLGNIKNSGIHIDVIYYMFNLLHKRI